MSEVTRELIKPDDVVLAVYREGDPNAPTVLLVHGFPDDSSVWDGVAERLRDRYQVVRYDVRGAGRSGKPAAREDYRLERLAADLAAVVRVVSPRRPVHLVGHDWGSLQCWEAITDPAYVGLFASYTTISGPCLDHVGHWIKQRLRRRTPRDLRELISQLLRSWYIVAFRIPVLPQLGWRYLTAPLWARIFPGRSTRAVAADGVNGIKLYRANMPNRLRWPGRRRTNVPVRQLVPTKDPFVSPALVTCAEPWCDRLSRHDIQAGHWTVRSHPDLVAGYIADFVEACA